LTRPDWAQVLKYGGGLLLLFVLGAYKTSDLCLAALMVACFVVGYLNVFSVLRGVIAVFKRQNVGAARASLIAGVLLADVVLVYAGAGWALVLVTVCLLIIDAALLRFR
jgi:hypothetical protein